MRVETRRWLSGTGGSLLAVWSFAASGAGVVGTGTAGSCTETALNTALAGGGAVTFNCGASPVTIPITATKSITAGTSILGGNLVTLDGGGSVPLFNVTGGGLSLGLLTLTRGFSSDPSLAAAITSTEHVTLNSVNVVGNTSTGVSCMAINVSGASLNIVRSTVANNVGSGASGSNVICTNATATFFAENSTFTGNTNVAGGGIFVSGTGQFVYSTVAGNTSNLGNSAISAFGGTVRLGSSIVSNNPGGNCSTAGGGTFVDDGYNLQYPGNSCGGSIQVADPLLGPLASNGGSTQTMALPAGSPALDRIPFGTAWCGTSVAIDQRVSDRPQPASGPCDIGAFEASATLNGQANVPALGLPGLLALAAALSTAALIVVRRSV